MIEIYYSVKHSGVAMGNIVDGYPYILYVGYGGINAVKQAFRRKHGLQGKHIKFIKTN